MNWNFLVPLVFSVIVMIINSCKYCCRFLYAVFLLQINRLGLSLSEALLCSQM